MKVGFIGLGNMGAPMAANLLKAGHEVTIWSRRPQAAEPLRSLGAQVADSAPAAFAGDAFISMLPDDPTVRAIVVDGGLLPVEGSSTIHINMATISVALCDELTALHRNAGVPYVAAPVFGRPDVAAAGRLNILAAGPAAAIETAQPLFDAMGQKTWMLGDVPSAANAVKLCCNFMVYTAIESLSQAAALANASGVGTRDFLTIATTVGFDSPVYRSYARIIGEQLFEPAGMKLTLALKDVRLILSAGEAANVPLPFASVMRDAYIEAIAHDLSDADAAAVSEVALRRANRPTGGWRKGRVDSR